MPKIRHPSKVRVNVFMTAEEANGLTATAAKHMLSASQWVRVLVIKYGIDPTVVIDKPQFTTVKPPKFDEIDPSEIGTMLNVQPPKTNPGFESDADLLPANDLSFLEEDETK